MRAGRYAGRQAASRRSRLHWLVTVAMAQKHAHVFLSYARSDKHLVREVVQWLQDEGLDVWDPDERILPGANWNEELQEALDSADALLAFISPEAIASRSVSHEIEYALGARHLRGRLIPVMIRPTKDAPWILDSLQPVQYQSPVKTGRQIVQLLSRSDHAPETETRAE